jgi:hypothetical protein
MTHIQLILEAIENDPTFSNETNQAELMEEVAAAIAHITQMVAHKVAKKCLSENGSEDEYIDIIRRFRDIVKTRIDSPTIKPEGIKLRMISDEFNNLINRY